MKNNNHKDRAHALLSPSGASRWMNCPASIKYESIFPEVISPYAAEGTLAHEKAEEALKLLLHNKDSKHYKKYLNNIEDRDLAEHVESYCDYCAELLSAFFEQCDYKDCKVFIEQKFHITENIWGTSDFGLAGIRNGKRSVLVTDLKYGQGQMVSAEDNPQLMTYGLGIAKAMWGQHHEVNDLPTWLPDEMHLRIFQPRGQGETKKRCKVSYEEIIQFYVKLGTHEERVLQVLNDERCDPKDPTTFLLRSEFHHLNPGSWCRFCKAAGECPAIRQDVLDLIEPLPAVEDSLPVPHSLDAQIKLQKYKKFIEHMLDANEANLTMKLEMGMEIPGFKLVETRGKRSWAFKGKPLMDALVKKGIKADKVYKKTPITLLEAEKILGKEKISDLVSPPAVRKQIVAVDDYRDSLEIDNLMDAIPIGE